MERENFYKMIEERERTIENGKSNCFGTALYLTGEKDIDTHEKIVDPQYLKELQEVQNPEKGFFIVWYDQNSRPVHIGVIKNSKPLYFSNKTHSQGEFHSNETMDSLKEFYQKNFPKFNLEDKKIKYLVPSKLQKILEEENTK